MFGSRGRVLKGSGRVVVAALLAMVAGPAPGRAAGMPVFQYVYGTPAITLDRPWNYTSNPDSGLAPPLAVEDSQIYVGGKALLVLDKAGGTRGSWPSNPGALGLGRGADLVRNGPVRGQDSSRR